MAVSYSTQRVTSNGTLSTLALSIEYFDRSEIEVLINDTLSTAWSWTTPTSKTIQFTAAPLPNGTTVLVRRITDISAIRHEYTGGAQFTYLTLDENFTQILHIAQEAAEGVGVGDLYNNLNMHLYKIRNLGTATQPGDAVSLGQYQADANGAYASKLAAQAAEAQALIYKDSAGSAAITSTLRRDEAVAARNVAVAARDTAQVYANTAAGQATAASNAAAAANTALDEFTDLYLGRFASNPSTDNDGAALQVGALYYNSTVLEMRVWNGAAWVAAYVSDQGYLAKNQNLSDLQSVSTARTNLGLGTAALLVATANTLDPTVGRALRVGDFGLGTVTAIDLQGAAFDCGNALNFGCYTINPSTENNPGFGGTLLALPRTLGAYNQLMVGVGRAAFRSFSGTWQPWIEISSNKTGVRVETTTGSIGYKAGAGGAVTQATGKSTAVTLNTAAGRVTMHNAALAAGASVAFNLNNTAIDAEDTVIVSSTTGNNASSYRVEVFGVITGAVGIRVTNISAGSLSDALQLNFTIIKGAIA